METKEYRSDDKSSWGPGEWQDEPDKKQWTDEVTGLPCLIVRASHGALCGYVGVPADHPYYGKDYGDVSLRAHCEVNFSKKCSDGPEAQAICHIPGPGESDDIWWFGFDCAHYMDRTPAIKPYPLAIAASQYYRNFEYVTSEVQRLAKQLKEVA